MSTDIGFASCDLIDIPDHTSNGEYSPHEVTDFPVADV